MARCNDCNKFVSYNTEMEPELENEDVDGGTHMTATVRRVLGCSECGSELKSFEFDVDVDFAEHLEEHQKKCVAKEDGEEVEYEDHSWSVEIELTPTEGIAEETNAKGRKVKKTAYGYEGQATLTCDQCECTVEFPVSGQESVSSFEEC